MVSARWLSVVRLSAAAASLGASFASHAAGTPAGTNIQNTAHVSYTIGSSTVTTDSNTSSVTVAERLDAVLTIANPTVTVSPGATGEELVFTLTNTGNGSERFNLTALSAGAVDHARLPQRLAVALDAPPEPRAPQPGRKVAEKQMMRLAVPGIIVA